MPRKCSTSHPGTRKYGTKSNYTNSTLQEALAKIKLEKMSIGEASKIYKVPKATLFYKLKNKHCNSVVRPIALSIDEELCFENHLLYLSDKGIPIGINDFKSIVKIYLDDSGKNIQQFKDNRPGWEWCKLYLDRHPSLKEKVSHCISRKRAQINYCQIKLFFQNLEKELNGVTPDNIYNMDETGFHDDPGKKKLIFRRSSRHPELIRNTTKTCYTVVFCGNASGKLIPPFFIFKGKHSWSDWLFNAPEGSRMATSCSGWMEIQIFEEWLLNHFVPNIINKEDVGYFSSLKANWRSVLNQWRKTSRGKKVNNLPKHLFTQLIKSTLNVGKENLEHNLQAEFKATGIYPFLPEHVLSKLPSFTNIDIQLNIGESFRNYVDDIHLNYEVSKKFKLPITAGKRVSATEVEAYYKERDNKKKSQDNIRAKKRGRPLGSNNMVMKINKKLNILQSSSIVNVDQVIEDDEQVLPVSQNDAVFSLEQINNHYVHVFLDHDYFVKELVETQD
nr:uncharacterized protein LOC124806354 isoform X1 [Hydra vulgaris]XP_047123101.1 uncharacterized protein LOC124806354 isoform X1 [Hydra vulgaris]XP_047123102.1 uncharacterized protein LOC124806354 isoform X1 [Hydra vulgaris]